MNKAMKALVATAAVVGLSGGAVAIAAIPDSNGVIHGCINNISKGLRVVDYPTETCKYAETPLNWNQGGSAPAHTIATINGVRSPNRPQEELRFTCPAGKQINSGAADLLSIIQNEYAPPGAPAIQSKIALAPVRYGLDYVDFRMASTVGPIFQEDSPLRGYIELRIR